MRVFKPLRLGLLTKTVPHNGAGLFVISTLTAFDLLDPRDILADAALWPIVAKELPKGAIFDAAYPKPSGEFFIAGKAMSAEPVQAMNVAVSVGSLQRKLSVFGDRTWQAGPDGPVLSQPVPFNEMPLTPERAFGGESYAGNPVGRGSVSADLVAHTGSAPLPNVELSGLEIKTITDRPQPALVGPIAMDDPARMKLTGTFDKAWTSLKMPEWPDDFDPRYYMSAPHPQRFDHFFQGDEPVRVVGMSANAPDVQSRLPGVRARAFVVKAGSGSSLIEVRLRTDTAWIFGSELKGVVVNRGFIDVSDRDGTEISDIMIAYEWLADSPRSTEHYQHVYDLRSDPDEGYKYLLADSQLSPEEDPEETARREQARIAETKARLDKWAEGRQWRLKHHFAECGLPASLVPAIDDPDVRPFMLPSKEDLERGDVDFARMISDAEELQQEAELKANVALAELDGILNQLELPKSNIPKANPEILGQSVEAVSTGKGFLPGTNEILPQGELNALLEGFKQVAPADQQVPAEPDAESAFEAARNRFIGSLSSELMEPARTLVENMPQTGSAEELQLGDVAAAEIETGGDDALAAYLAESFPAAGGVDGSTPLDTITSALSQAPADPAVGDTGAEQAKAKLAEAEENLDDALLFARRNAAEQIAPLTPLGELAAARFGEYIRDHVANGGTLAGRDMAGASLGALEHDGVDLTGSFLEACNLSGARLRRANAVDTVFAGATLSKADFSGADMTRANLSKVGATQCGFREARFSGSTIVGANFSGCDFSGAVFEDCTFLECALPNTTLSGATLKDCSFVNCDLTELKADRLRLEKTVFLSCPLDASDWSDAVLQKASFADTSFRAAVFSRATLDECGWFGPTDMTSVKFTDVQAAKCGLQDARMPEADFLRAIFNGCNLASANLEAADMRLASFKESLFAFARIRGADMFGANLLGASFHGADLRQSSFRSANFFRTDLSDAKLAFADFTRSNMELTNMEARV
ncbi:DUF2169 domain-containing protein [uncultured Roseibium sp.]|uniref:DUF2169 family type VI secretion system accessory protein n=1 Tax=uncultured Roseibium sp. TaxID=1936171 RepID=UPI002614CC9D|nr:DUF2169 domain-containing protein [uncultured Roseibium sp.]